MKYFAGIDQSLSGTGLVVIDQKHNIVAQKLIASDPKRDIAERIFNIYNNIVAGLLPYNEGLARIGMEGLSTGKLSRSLTDLAGLYHYIRVEFMTCGLLPLTTIVSPGEIKKFVTGKGNAKKDLMLLKVYKKWGEEFDDDNLCDAYCLARYVANMEG